MAYEEIKKEILARLRGINLYKVILFGSFADENPKEHSDIDLLVVTDDDYLPKNYDENINNYLRVSSSLRDLKKTIPMDLIVHTKPMHDAFLNLGSMFSKEVVQKGKVLYEKNI
jgi:uncharacterized protein